jgi:aryl-alcohol dehydrogenase-like predicted oxidoreductase
MTCDNDGAFRQLGSAGPSVFPLALGRMGMSGMYGPTEETESIATIHAALDQGVTLLDTGDFYGTGHNEMLIGRALRDRRDKALLSVKFGALRSPDGSWIGYDARPAAVKNFVAYSLVRLGLDHIDICRPARLDPKVPIEETIGAIAELVKAGYVRAIGLSEVGPETIRRAQAVHPICDLQIEYSLMSRGPEAKILPALSDLAIGVTAYGVLSRGLLSGSQPAIQGDLRARFPRFTGANRQRNQAVVDTLRRLASEKKSPPCAAGDCLGAGQERYDRARDWRTYARAAFGVPRRAAGKAIRSGHRPDRGSDSRLGHRGNPLRRAPDADAG